MKFHPLSNTELKRMGFLRDKSPAEREQQKQDYNAQIEMIPHRIRERFEARLANGWGPQFAFEDAVHHAANVGDNREATIQQMTLGASELARGWEHSDVFVAHWNAMFPDAARVSGFACPCTVDLPDGRRAAIAAEWSVFLAQRKADA